MAVQWHFGSPRQRTNYESARDRYLQRVRENFQGISASCRTEVQRTSNPSGVDLEEWNILS